MMESAEEQKTPQEVRVTTSFLAGDLNHLNMGSSLTSYAKLDFPGMYVFVRALSYLNSGSSFS